MGAGGHDQVPPEGGRAGEVRGRAAALRASLQGAQDLAGRTCRALDTLALRAAEMEAGMRPVEEATRALSRAHTNIDDALGVASEALGHYDAARELERIIQVGPSAGLDKYLDAIQRLERAQDFLSGNLNLKSAETTLASTNSLLDRARQQCRSLFKSKLQTSQVKISAAELRAHSIRSGGGGGDGVLELLRMQDITAIIQMADSVMKDNAQDCLSLYVESRRTAFGGLLRALGADGLAGEDISRMGWDALQDRIDVWLSLMGVTVALVQAEKDLAELIFSEPECDQASTGAVQTGLATLFNQGIGIARSRKSPEKVFALLDMFGVVQEVEGPLEDIFFGMESEALQGQLGLLGKTLRQAARTTFADLGEAIANDGARPPSKDATVHPLAAYVIHYLRRLQDYPHAIETLFGAEGDEDDESCLGSFSPGDGGFRNGSLNKTDPRSGMAAAVEKILGMLQTNLGVKAETYKGAAVSELFLLNNSRFILSAVQKSSLGELVGNAWLSGQQGAVKAHADAFFEAAWGPLVVGLRGDPSTLGPAEATAMCKTANALIEHARRTHRQWAIPDADLKAAVKDRVRKAVVPAYARFLAACSAAQPVVHAKCARFSVEDVSQTIGEMYEGL